jgi:RimJ/RimL family protein N-acetyltransferase
MTSAEGRTAVRAEPIRTDRLDLLPLEARHAAEMAEVLADPGLHTFIGGAPAALDALRTRYARLLAGSPDPAVSWCNWVIRLRDEACLTGTVQATITAGGGDRSAEIAWVVGTPWQRRGIAAEAARGLVAWLARRAVRTITAHIHPDHQASAAVATAAGLTPTGQWHDGEIAWRLALA